MKTAVTSVAARAYTIPTDRPEADGTLSWNETTIVIVHAGAGGKTGLGYTYAARAAAELVNGTLADALKGRNALDIPACWARMQEITRNLGVTGQVSAAIAAVDTALWDLKARLLGMPLAALMGAAREAVPVYGSGGFTTYDARDIAAQIEGWRGQGMTMAKIKIGAHPEEDPGRVAAARRALGNGSLFVDANGACGAKQALEVARGLRDAGVSWFEEPVPSDDLDGLRLVRERAPAGMDIAAGEYSYDIFTARRLLAAGAVDVMQIDATRCLGYTGFMHAASLALAAGIPVSSHCAPALHLPVCLHAPHLRHMEYFHDHVRIEGLLFDGAPQVKGGVLAPDLSRPGNGLVLKKRDAESLAA